VLLERKAAIIREELGRFSHSEQTIDQQNTEEEKKSTDIDADPRQTQVLRRSYNTPLRARVITLTNEWGPTKTSKKTGIPVENIKRWLKKGPQRKRGSGRPIKHPDLDFALVAYVKHQRDLKLAVPVRKLLAKARQLCRDKNITDLKLSNGWVQKFCHRHNLVRRKKSTTITKDDNSLELSIRAFTLKFVYEVLEGEVYDHDQVLNFDETSISRDAPSNYTLEGKGARRVAIRSTGQEKTNYTMALTVSLTGEKLRSVLIWPGTGEARKKCVVPDNTFIYYREKSWMNKILMLKWVNDVVAKRTRKLKQGKRGLVIVDGVSFHKDKEVNTNVF
jgi:hypothetical protein